LELGWSHVINAVNLLDITFMTYLKFAENLFANPRKDLGLDFARKLPAWREGRSLKVSLPLVVFKHATMTWQENCILMKDVAGKMFEVAIEEGVVIQTCNDVKIGGNRFL
jgi:hypothetical protein